MVVLRVLNNSIGDEFSVAEYGLVVVVRCQITVDHLRVISYTNLELNFRRIIYLLTSKQCRNEFVKDLFIH